MNRMTWVDVAADAAGFAMAITTSVAIAAKLGDLHYRLTREARRFDRADQRGTTEREETA